MVIRSLKPIITKELRANGNLQINFALSLKKALKDEKGILYKYVLSCFDVFPRYIFLRSLKSKDTTECINQKKGDIYDMWQSKNSLL